MARLLSIGFSFFQEDHYTLIRVIEKPTQTEYHVTVLNHELDQLLYGNNVFVAKDGSIHLDRTSHNKAQEILRMQIAEAISDHLKVF